MSDVVTLRVQSESDPKREYVVHVLGGEAVCSCIGFGTHGRCKHEQAAKTAMKNMEESMTGEATQGDGNGGATTAVATRQDDARPQALTVHPPGTQLPTRPEMRLMFDIAKTVVLAKGMVPESIRTPQQALAVMLAGREVGLAPMTALRHVYIVNGRTELETRAMVGVIRAKDNQIRFAWPEYTQEAVTCVVRRPGQEAVTVRYTLDDAKKSGQYEGKMGIWKKYTRDMLYAAATKRACRLSCPDLINAIEAGAPIFEAEAYATTDAGVDDDQLSIEAPPADPAAHEDPGAYNEGDDRAMPAEAKTGAETPAPAEQAVTVRIRVRLQELRGQYAQQSFDRLLEGLRQAYAYVVDEKSMMMNFSQLRPDDAARLLRVLEAYPQAPEPEAAEPDDVPLEDGQQGTLA